MEEKVYTQQVIQDNPFPQDITLLQSASNPVSGEVHKAQEIKDQPLPVRKIAQDLIGPSLNTQSRKILGDYTFTESGALSIGKYENQVSGDIRLTPIGLTARNKQGETTLNVDGETGDVTLKGTLLAGSVIAAQISADQLTAGTLGVGVNVGASNIILDGANKRLIINDGTHDRVLIGYQAGGF